MASDAVPEASIKDEPKHSNFSEVGVGIINIPMLQAMHDQLSGTPNEEDKKLADWVHENYFVPPPGKGEDCRIIKSDTYFIQLYAAYQRVQQLTARTCPEKWPFFTNSGWKEMPKSVVKQKATSSNITHSHRGAKVNDPVQNLGNHSTGKALMAEQDLKTTLTLPDSLSLGTLQAADAASPSRSISLPAAVYSDPILTSLDRRPPSTNSKRKIDTIDTQNKRVKHNSSMVGRGRGRGRGHGRGRGGRNTNQPRQLVDDEPRSPSSKQRSSPLLELVEPVRQIQSQQSPACSTSSFPITETSHSELSRTTKSIVDEHGIDEKGTLNLPLEDMHCIPSPEVSQNGRSPSIEDEAEDRVESHDDRFVEATLGDVEPTVLHTSPYTPLTQQSVALASQHSDNHVMAASSPKVSVCTNSIPSKERASNGISTTSVQFFARVSTAKGSMEISLPCATFIGSDVELIERYAEWKQQEEDEVVDMNLSFDQFVKVFGFAKKS